MLNSHRASGAIIIDDKDDKSALFFGRSVCTRLLCFANYCCASSFLNLVRSDFLSDRWRDHLTRLEQRRFRRALETSSRDTTNPHAGLPANPQRLPGGMLAASTMRAHLPSSWFWSRSERAYLPSSCFLLRTERAHLPRSWFLWRSERAHLPSSWFWSRSERAHLPSSWFWSVTERAHLPSSCFLSVTERAHLPSSCFLSRSERSDLPIGFVGPAMIGGVLFAGRFGASDRSGPTHP